MIVQKASENGHCLTRAYTLSIYFSIFFLHFDYFYHKFALLCTDIYLLGPKELTESNSIYFE